MIYVITSSLLRFGSPMSIYQWAFSQLQFTSVLCHFYYCEEKTKKNPPIQLFSIDSLANYNLIYSIARLFRLVFFFCNWLMLWEFCRHMEKHNNLWTHMKETVRRFAAQKIAFDILFIFIFNFYQHILITWKNIHIPT